MKNQIKWVKRMCFATLALAIMFNTAQFLIGASLTGTTNMLLCLFWAVVCLWFIGHRSQDIKLVIIKQKLDEIIEKGV